jgi:hypothetical protein
MLGLNLPIPVAQMLQESINEERFYGCFIREVGQIAKNVPRGIGLKGVEKGAPVGYGTALTQRAHFASGKIPDSRKANWRSHTDRSSPLLSANFVSACLSSGVTRSLIVSVFRGLGGVVARVLSLVFMRHNVAFTWLHVNRKLCA